MTTTTPTGSSVLGDIAIRNKPLHLSKDRLRNVFMNTSDLSRLCSSLSIPHDIKRDVVNVTEYYHKSTQPRKVRKLIFRLDWIRDTALADSVMDCAEPPADPSIIPHHLIPVFQAITKDWAMIGDPNVGSSIIGGYSIGGYYTTVPHARAELFRTKFSVSDQRTEAGKYYALYHMNPNWKKLSLFLYSEGETLALDIARPYIQTVTDPTLTPPNLMHAHRHITIWDSVYSYDYLNIPESQHEEIVAKFDGEEAKLQLFTTWLTSHPCPTWDDVKNLLRRLEREGIGREGAADEVEETYIKMTPLKAKQILDASLQDGSLPLGYLKTMAVGVARSGKTLSKKHIFKMKCDPNCSVSTGILESPVFAFRSISLEMINASSSVKGFQPLKFNDINQVLAHKLRKGMLRGRVAEVAEDIVKTASEGSSSSSPSEGIAASSVASPSGDSAASKAVVSAVCDVSRDRAEEEELYKLQVILYFDSGGQPQYHELVPALSHNVSLVQIFIKLNERLDALCIHAFTDEEGKWFREMCSSLLTNEQMVLQLVHTMMCKPLADSNKGIRTMFMIIGTHRDLIHKCNETLAEKNERLASLLLPALDEVLIMNGIDIIFDVNAMSPDEYDEKRFDLIREKVSDLSVALQRDTPMSSLMLLNDVMRHGEECRKRALSMEECQAIAGRLKMDRQGLQAALFHYNQMSLFMYIPSILPNTVFLDPQMPLDSVNRLVQYSFRVGEGAIRGLTANECRLWKEGVVTSDRLKGVEFSSCFVSGLFEVDDALKLFLSLYIVARLNESEFIMPAMLQTVSLQDMKRYIPTTSSHVSSLLLHFHKSRIANGVFCSTHACMRSKYRWTTCYTFDKLKRMKVPACLFRNAVRLQHPSKPIKLTFFHAQKHFEVYLTAPEAELPSICPEVREMLLDAVDSAANAFRYTNSRATIAFQCPCDPDDIHTATLNEPGSNLICTLTEEIILGGLTAAQKMWLGPYTAPESKPVNDSAPMSSSHTTQTITGVSTPSTTGVSTPSPPSRMDEKPKLPELLTFKTITGDINITNKVGTNFEMLGIILLEDEDGSTVAQIIECKRQPAAIVLKILTVWVQGGGKHPVTWKTLTDTLKVIGLIELASGIEQALCQ